MDRNNILYIDNEEKSFNILYEKLKKRDIFFDYVSSPIEALSILQKKPYHIVITDHDMPELNGDEFIQKAKQRGIIANFMVLSQFEDQRWRERKSFRAGSLSFFFKSNISPLIDAIECLQLLSKIGIHFPDTFRLYSIIESEDMMTLLGCLKSDNNVTDFRFLLSSLMHISSLLSEDSKFLRKYLVEIGCNKTLVDLIEELDFDDKNNLEGLAWELNDTNNNNLPKIFLADLMKIPTGIEIINKIIIRILHSNIIKNNDFKKIALILRYRSDKFELQQRLDIKELIEIPHTEYIQPWIIELCISVTLREKSICKFFKSIESFPNLTIRPEKCDLNYWKALISYIKGPALRHRISGLDILENVFIFWQLYFKLLSFYKKLEIRERDIINYIDISKNLLSPFRFHIDFINSLSQKNYSLNLTFNYGITLIEKFESCFANTVIDPDFGYSKLYQGHLNREYYTVASIIDQYIIPNYSDNSVEEIYFIIFDGMSNNIMYYLNERFFKNYFEFKYQQYDILFSILPSSTIYSRRSIFAGKFPCDFGFDPDPFQSGKKNRTISEHDLLINKMKLSPKEAKSVKNNFCIHEITAECIHDDKVNKIIDAEGKLKVIIFKMMDDLIHKATDKIEDFGNLFFNLYIKSYIEKIFLKKNAYLIFTSDHGFINSTKKVNYPYVKKHSLRYLCDDIGSNLIPENKKSTHYTLIDGSKWGLPNKSFRFALGNTLFYKSNGVGPKFAHGGISLSEMIIPVLTFYV